MTKPVFTDVMVDLETTGLSPDENAIIQIAAVRFNPLTAEVDGSDMFDECLMIPPKRFWDESTRDWWFKRPDTLHGIMNRMAIPGEVMQRFSTWATGPGGIKLRFWSKPSHFDFMFLQSYAKQFNVLFPFDFREAQDMRSFLRGYYYPKPVPDLDIKLEGVAHNAIFDVLHQIQVVLKHLEQ